MSLATLTIPAPCQMLNSNQRMHRMAAAKLTAQWRMAAKVAARQVERPDLPKPVRIIAYIYKARANHYDPNNLYPTIKACCDGAVDAKWLDEDNFSHVIGPDMRHGGTGEPRIVFEFVNP